MSETNTLWKSPYIVLLLCTLIILISYGTRQSFGIFLVPISDSISGGRVEPFSFAVSLQTLIIGISVPFVSMIADKCANICRIDRITVEDVYAAAAELLDV